MDKHTIKHLKTWEDKENIKSRAKRGKATSAPDEETLEIEKRLFKIAQANKKKVRTLVLGATPELRDLAISMGSETVAVDISPRLLLAMTNVMKFKDDPKNKFMVEDWLKLHKFLEKNSFDIVLADISINNIPYDKWEDFFKSLNYVMKKNAYFITRSIVFNYPSKLRTYKEVIDEFKKNNISVMEMMVELGLSTETIKQGYNHKKKEMSWKSFEKYGKELKKDLSKQEYSFFENIMKHAKDLTTIIVSEREFIKILRKYFYLKKRKIANKIGTTYRLPVYFLKNKKNLLSDIIMRFRK